MPRKSTGTPQPAATAVDLQRHLIDMPPVAKRRSAGAQLRSVGWPELVTPQDDGFTAYTDAASGAQLLDIAMSEKREYNHTA